MQTKNWKTFFADEKEAYAKMLNDWISADNAMAAIRERRSKLIPSWKIEQEYLLRLRELANQGMTSKDAVKKVFQERREKQYQSLPWYKKVGKSLFDAGVWAVSTATSWAANAYDWGQSIFTGEKSEAGEMADEIQNTTQRITWDSASSQFWNLAWEAALFYASGWAAGTLGKTAAVTGGVLSKAPVIWKVAAPVVNTIWKTANVIWNWISKWVNKVIPKWSWLWATFWRNAIYWWAFEWAAEIFRNWSDAKMEDIVSSATMWAVAWWALWVWLEKWVFWYWKDLIKWNFKKAGKDFVDDVSGVGTEIKGFFDNKTQGIATKISNNANRFTKWDIEKFTKMTGETPGEWAINRWLTSVWDDAVEQAVKYYQASMKQADKWFESITWKFKDTGDDYMWTMLGDLLERYEKTAVWKEKLWEMTNLYNKYQTEGLTMPEINQVKREYQKNFKYSWVESGSEWALRSTNIQNWVREWQFKLASENWFKNIAEINKNTQWWKAYADMLWKQVSWTQWNNPISITDWIALSGWNPGNIWMFLWKQVWKLPIVKKWAMKLFWKQTKDPLVEAEVEGIAKTRNKFTNKTIDFNDALNELEKWTLKSDRIITMELENPVLQDIFWQTTFPLKQRTLKDKVFKHWITYEDIRWIDKASREPIMIYRAWSKAESVLVVTDLNKWPEKITIALKYNKDGSQISEISSIHPKDLVRLQLEKNANKISEIYFEDTKKLQSWKELSSSQRGAVTSLDWSYGNMILKNQNKSSENLKSYTNRNLNAETEAKYLKNSENLENKLEIWKQRNIIWKKVDEIIAEPEKLKKISSKKRKQYLSKELDLDFSWEWSFSKFRNKNANYMIASAENPMWKQASKLENEVTHRGFAEFMKKNGISYKEQLWHYWQPERSYIIKIEEPGQRKLIDDWLEKNTPQAENLVIKDWKAVRYDPRTKEAYMVDLNNVDLEIKGDVDDFYSMIDGRKYKLPLYDPNFEKELTIDEFRKIFNS